MAELLTARLLDMGVNSNQIETITFGAPAVGNKTFVDMYEPKMNLTRITMKGDIVKNLAQIANERFVQFNTNEVWAVSKLENDKLLIICCFILIEQLKIIMIAKKIYL
mgnify:CR=1 FL=1